MLSLASTIFVLVALLHTGAGVPPANPTCGDFRIMSCLLAPIAYVMSNPQGMAMIQKMSNRSQDALPTQDELNIVCQSTTEATSEYFFDMPALQSTALDCIGDFINQCTASIPNAANFHEFVNGTVAASRSFCARPNLHSDIKLAVQCLKQAGAKFGNSSCADKGDWIDAFACFNNTLTFDAGGLDFTGLRTYFHENDILGGICCTMDKIRHYARQEITGTCSPQADAVIKDIFQLLDASFSCSGRLAGCSTVSQRIRTKKNGCRLPS